MRKKLSCLIVEPNPYHGNILPGFTKYFQDIGYDVAILCNPGAVKDNPFVYYPEKMTPIVMTMSPSSIVDYLASEKADNYDVIFFSTNVYWEQDKNYSSWIGFADKIPKNHRFIMVDHNLSYLDFDAARALYYQRRIGTILDFSKLGYDIPDTMVNPHYIGEIKKTIDKKIDDVTITVIGSSSFAEENLWLLIDALRKCPVDSLKRLKVQLVGGMMVVPEDLKSTIVNIGRVSYKSLYSIAASSDFVMTLVDSKVDVQEKYTQGTTSGTMMLSLAVTIPIISTISVVECYGLSKNVAIGYKEGDSDSLADSLVSAVNLKNKDYMQMVERVSNLAEKIDQQSRSNLEALLADLYNNDIKELRYVNEVTLRLARDQVKIQELQGSLDEQKKTTYCATVKQHELASRLNNIEKQYEEARHQLAVIKRSRRYRLLSVLAKFKP